MNMSAIKLPTLTLKTKDIDPYHPKPIDIQQINQSSLLAYLGIRGVGNNGKNGICERDFNAIPLIAYWDIYKNYYANKQEGIGVMISSQGLSTIITGARVMRKDDLVWTSYGPYIDIKYGDILYIDGVNLDLYSIYISHDGEDGNLNDYVDLISNNGNLLVCIFTRDITQLSGLSINDNLIPDGIS